MQCFYKKFIYLLYLVSIDLGFVAATQQWYTANDGLKYLIEVDLKYNYLQAIDECARKDLQLLVIDNAEKNAAIMKLLESLSEKPGFLWLDLHDEFNKDVDLNRTFYSLSNGHQNKFAYWDTNEPSNRDSNEHCVEMLINSDYKWNDINCDAPLHGYICEEHHLVTSHKSDLDQRRNLTHLTHANTIKEFQIQSKQISDINIKTRETTNSLMTIWKNSVKEIKSNLPEEDKQKAFDRVTTATLQSIEATLLKAQNEINRITSLHSVRLESDTVFINGLLSH